MSEMIFALRDPDDPRIACKYAVVSHPLYRKCELCKFSEDCTIGSAELHFRENDEVLEKAFKVGILNREDYIINDLGHYVHK